MSNKNTIGLFIDTYFPIVDGVAMVVDNYAKRLINYAKKIVEIMKNEDLYKKVCENEYKDIYINWDNRIQEVFDLYIKFIENNKKTS